MKKSVSQRDAVYSPFGGSGLKNAFLGLQPPLQMEGGGREEFALDHGSVVVHDGPSAASLRCSIAAASQTSEETSSSPFCLLTSSRSVSWRFEM